jgi:hypothetical protein
LAYDNDGKTQLIRSFLSFETAASETQHEHELVAPMSSQSFKKDNPEVGQFLKRHENPASKFANLTEVLGPALDRPDGITHPPAPAPIRDLTANADGHSGADQALAKLPHTNDMELPVGDSPSVNGRPRHGKKPKVEKTFAIPPEIHQQLISISNHEGIRHDKKFSVSYIMGHLLEYALSHVEGTKVIPDSDGDGLVIRKIGAAQ